MKLINVAAIATIAIAMSGCARSVTVMSAPNLNVYTSYTSKVPGKWAMYVNAENLNREVKPDGLSCAAYNWPLDLRSAFKHSVGTTFRNLVEDVELVDQPVAADSVTSQGYAGVIRVNGDDMRIRLSIIPGFFSSTAQVTAEIDAGILVDGPDGRLLGTQAEGAGHGDHGTGMACEGSAVAIQSATEQAMKTVIGQLAERFSNSPNIRPAKRTQVK